MFLFPHPAAFRHRIDDRIYPDDERLRVLPPGRAVHTPDVIIDIDVVAREVQIQDNGCFVFGGTIFAPPPLNQGESLGRPARPLCAGCIRGAFFEPRYIIRRPARVYGIYSATLFLRRSPKADRTARKN